jgi:hypothetical protein
MTNLGRWAVVLASIGGPGCTAEAVSPERDSPIEQAYVESRRHAGVVAADEAPAPVIEERTPGVVDHVGHDFVEPSAEWRVSWTEGALDRRSLDELSYTIVNQSNRQVSIAVSLHWDSGTTRVRQQIVDRFELLPHATVVRAVDRGALPSSIASARYPGLVGVSLASTEDQTVLPAFFLVPRSSNDFPEGARWPYELMTADDLARTMASAARFAEDGSVVSRVVEWVPTEATADEDGGA